MNDPNANCCGQSNDDPTRRRGVVGVIREKCRGEQPCTIYDVNDVETST